MRALLIFAVGLLGCSSLDILGSRAVAVSDDDGAGGSGEPQSGTGGRQPNLLEERTDVPLSQVNADLNDAFAQLFFGDPETEAVFRDLGDGTAYIEDIFNQEVRADAMGYGMLVAVELNQREVFDKLWAYAKLYMQSPSGPTEGLLRWRCDTEGQNCADSAATDSSSVIATSLFIADSRWGAGGAHPYAEDGLVLLERMAAIEDRNGGVVDGVVNCFNPERALPRIGSMSSEEETPVDYLMPAFYEIWATKDLERAVFWQQVAENSRTLLRAAPHPTTGLVPERLSYTGSPVSGADTYQSTAHRVHLNLSLDALWSPSGDWIRVQNEARLDFFLAQGIDDYVAEYSLAGDPLLDFNTAAHRSLVALAAGTSPDAKYDEFLVKLLEEDIPTGAFRYYDGMIYMLSLLVLSGQMTPH